jgi:hypothetical protein
MSNKLPRLGIDRFLALRWVDMALEMRMVTDATSSARKQFRAWLSQEIEGNVSADKTAYQINRIWLIDDDPFDNLRKMAISNGLANDHRYRPVLHFGLAINVFPLFVEVCKATGRLLNLQPTCTNHDIVQRVQEKFGNPESVKRASRRVLQTLFDWGLLIDRDGSISIQEFTITDQLIIEWLITALITSQSTDKIPLVDVVKVPELLGIRFEDARSAIRSASTLRIERLLDVEMVIVME